jgi:ribosomal protein S18 acetylase RimI-like enzyme
MWKTGNTREALLDLVRNMQRTDLRIVNDLFVSAFSHGRVEDGYLITHIPPCRLDFLSMYLSDFPAGCFVSEKQGEIIAAVMSHVWGKTGWIGPLAVAPKWHGYGYGSRLLNKAVSVLKDQACDTIGLETNPRSFKNVGFYLKAGFVSQLLTVDMLLHLERDKAHHADSSYHIVMYSQGNPSGKQSFVKSLQEFLGAYSLSIDHSPLLKAIDRCAYGESMLFYYKSQLFGYASIQSKPPSNDEDQNIMRVVAFLLKKGSPVYLDFCLKYFQQLAIDYSLESIMIRMPCGPPELTKTLLNRGYRIINTDLRMTLNGYPFRENGRVYVLDRWI